MLKEPLLLGLPIGAVAKLLGFPSQTANSWRNAGLLPDLGEEGKGRTGARHYGLGDMVVFAAMRDLTAGPAGISGALAAKVAEECRGMLLAELAGLAPPGRLLLIEAGADRCATEAVPPDGLAERVARWRRENRRTKRTRLEIVDAREIAVSVCARLSWFDGPRFEGMTEEDVRELVEADFQGRALMYLGEEVERYRNAAKPAGETDAAHA